MVPNTCLSACLVLYICVNRTAIESENDEDDDFAKVSSSSTNSEGQKEGETATTGATMQLTEVHLGCTIAQILKAKKHVLEGGLMSLMVFPKANQAPSDVYLKRFGGRKKCGLLTPIA